MHLICVNIYSFVRQEEYWATDFANVFETLKEMTRIHLNQSLHTKTFHVNITASGSQALFNASLILQFIFFKSLQLYFQMLPKKVLMEPFVYAPARMLGNWANVLFLKFLQLYYQMLPIKN